MKQRRLTDAQKIEMVNKYQTGQYNCTDLGKIYGISNVAIIGLLSRRNIKIFNDKSKLHRKYSLDENYFNTIDTEEKSYFLGLLYADGFIDTKNNSVNLSLQDIDKHILDTFKLELKSNRPLQFIKKNCKNSKWKDAYRLAVNSQRLCNSLVKLGCFNKKSFILEFPTITQVPPYLLSHFMRGYFDGDGCFTTHLTNEVYKKYTFSIVSTNNFCNDYGYILKNKVNIHFGIYQRYKNRDTNTRSMVISGKQTISVLDWLYQDSTIFLKRKYEKYLKEKSLINTPN